MRSEAACSEQLQRLTCIPKLNAACSHAIVSSSVGPEYYVNVMSFVDKSQLEPGCTVLLHNKVRMPAMLLVAVSRSHASRLQPAV